MVIIYICDYCKRKVDEELDEIILDGLEDFYVLNVCSNCYEILNDYFEPEYIDKIMGN